MLDAARRKAPELRWACADLASLDLETQFDVVVMAGNVMIFVEPGTEAQVVARMAAHLGAGGRLIAGFQLGQNLGLEQYDEALRLPGCSSRHASPLGRRSVHPAAATPCPCTTGSALTLSPPAGVGLGRSAHVPDVTADRDGVNERARSWVLVALAVAVASLSGSGGRRHR